MHSTHACSHLDKLKYQLLPLANCFLAAYQNRRGLFVPSRTLILIYGIHYFQLLEILSFICFIISLIFISLFFHIFSFICVSISLDFSFLCFHFSVFSFLCFFISLFFLFLCFLFIWFFIYLIFHFSVFSNFSVFSLFVFSLSDKIENISF